MKSIVGLGRFAATVITIATLGACGGGGGDGGPATFQQAALVDITSASARAVAAQGMDAAGAGGSGAGFLTVTGVELSAAPAEAASAFAALSDALRLSLRPRRSAALVGVVTTETVACSGGGSVTIAANVADPNVPTAGDSASLSFANCVEDVGTMNGGLSFGFAQIDAAAKYVVADATANQFTVTVAGAGPRLNGAIRLTIDLRDPALEVVRVTSEQFSFDRMLNGNVHATRTLLGFDYASTLTVASLSTSETFSYTLSGSFPRLGEVSMVVATTQPVVTADGALHPTSGAAKITGRDNKSVSITVVPTGLQLDVDTNGDGINTDVQFTATWAEIDGEL
ncbi:MAG TPA: hypothetical protein VFZ28_07025 [Burkholderiaceae bacterium]|nr:hypothetical protein [Burkholderiaceae bacterium]